MPASSMAAMRIGPISLSRMTLSAERWPPESPPLFFTISACQ